MIKTVTSFSPEFTPFLPAEYSDKRALYFDIETTGLSAQTSYVYLIGCAYEENGGFSLTQWLCTEPAEEKELLCRFFETAKEFDLLLHYNGTGFDLPFLEKKAVRHRLTSPLSALESLDLYNTARAMKKCFPLPDLKLKTMERFFGFRRTDIFSGGDLIEVYAKFLGLHRLNAMTNNQKQEEETALTHVLLLHNAEDVKNLPSLTVLLFLSALSSFPDEKSLLPLSGEPSFEVLKNRYFSDTADAVRECAGQRPDCSALKLCYSLPFPLPKDFSLSFPWENTEITLCFFSEKSAAVFSLPVQYRELKHFYPNPADYYYLPLEDCAMHKSIAAFVEKQYRKKATAATCYTKKTGPYLPLPSEYKKEAKEEGSASFPCFLPDYKSTFGYTPLTEQLLADPKQLTQLVRELLRYFL